MDGQNAQQIQPERNSGPGPTDVLEARITLQLAGAHDAVQRLMLEVHGLESVTHPHGMPARLRRLADHLDAALNSIRTLEDVQGDQL